MYYIFVENNKIIGKGKCKCLNDETLNFEVSEEIFNDFEKYIFKDGQIVLDDDFEEKQKQKEKERIARLSLTRGDVFRALLQAHQVTRDQIRKLIENNENLSEIKKEMALIDFDEALNFYRGNELIDILGGTLGISSEQLDCFFEDGDFKHLLS